MAVPRAHTRAPVLYGSHSSEIKEYSAWEAAFVILCTLSHLRYLYQSEKTKSIFILLERPVFLEFLCDLEE